MTIDANAARDTARVEYRRFGTNDCSLVEKCIGAAGRRRLLTFETVTPNIGTSDLEIGQPSANDPAFEYSACHDHYHFIGYAHYDLLAIDGSVAAVGHKESFCLQDTERYNRTDPTVRRTAQYDCDNQGISRGWSDTYTSDLDCQWVDVTDVPPGNYKLRIRINDARTIHELRYDNNDALVDVTIPP